MGHALDEIADYSNIFSKTLLMIAKVALKIPFSKPFDYRIPDKLESKIILGIRVIVPLKNRKVSGVIVGIEEYSEFKQLKFIVKVADEKPLFSKKMLYFTKWISEYYCSSWGEVLDAAIPSGFSIRFQKTFVIHSTSIHSTKIFENYPLHYQNWLLEIVGKTFDKIKKHSKYQEYEPQLNQTIQEKIASFEIHYIGKNQTLKTSIQYQLQDQNRSYPYRKNSKASKIIEYLKENLFASKDLILKTIPNSQNVLKELTKSNVLIKEEIKQNEEVLKQEQNITPFFLPLTQEQKECFKPIKAKIIENKFQCFLLHGVTGSGKTEVYLHSVQENLKNRKSSLILIPEIALTPQTFTRFKERFGNIVFILHSRMNEKERFNQWLQIQKSKCCIVIGTRSAIFAPIQNLGLIIIDEEHDTSYKQIENPQYNARDIAIKLASDESIPIVLGSATPAIESYWNALNHKYQLLEIKQRVHSNKMPIVEILDLSQSVRIKGAFYLSNLLLEVLTKNYVSGKQSILFLNRRGYASLLSCKSCETPVMCDFCSIAMTWHKNKQKLICHHCAAYKKIPSQCSFCKHAFFKEEGIGTERVEQDIQNLFPQSSIVRMDRDTIHNQKELEKKLDQIQKNEVQFIIGTQLISKGHDFPNIGLVCILMADISLNIPDFRSVERCFQLISQISGRSGRNKEETGNTIIQTFNPNHPMIQFAKEHDYISFYKYEIEKRNICNHFPFFKIIQIQVSDLNEKNAFNTISQIHSILEKACYSLDIQIHKPIEALIYKKNKRYYWQITLKSKYGRLLRNTIRNLFFSNSNLKIKHKARIQIHVDPYFVT